MITCVNDRMLEFLWFVGYCGEFPSQLVLRVGRNAWWNRHIKYRAIERGYVTVWRGVYRQRVIRSLRLTDKGLDYIGEKDPAALEYILAQPHGGIVNRVNMEKTLRYHSVAIGLLMAHNCGAIILPDQKPSLLPPSKGRRTMKPDPKQLYYYSVYELRDGIQAFEADSVAKSSRILGVIVQGTRYYCLYHTGHTRMYWMQNNEENTVASIDTLLNTRGFKCKTFSQVIIANNMSIAPKIAKYNVNHRSRYFTVSDTYQNCFYVENSARGDFQLRAICDPQWQQNVNRYALSGFREPPTPARTYDAVTPDGSRAVILGYQFDLLALLNIDATPHGFVYSPILLCFDYQVETVQAIVGPKIEVRSFFKGELYEWEKETGGAH